MQKIFFLIKCILGLSSKALSFAILFCIGKKTLGVKFNTIPQDSRPGDLEACLEHCSKMCVEITSSIFHVFGRRKASEAKGASTGVCGLVAKSLQAGI